MSCAVSGDERARAAVTLRGSCVMFTQAQGNNEVMVPRATVRIG